MARNPKRSTRGRGGGAPAPGNPSAGTPSAGTIGLILAGWAVPGLGHFLAGWRRRGILLAILLGGTFGAGLVLSDFEAVSRELHPYAFWAELGMGGATVPLMKIDPARDKVLRPPVHARFSRQDPSISNYESVPRHNDTGVLFCAIAGLLNLLALFDLAERLLARPRPAQPRKEGAHGMIEGTA